MHEVNRLKVKRAAVIKRQRNKWNNKQHKRFSCSWIQIQTLRFISLIGISWEETKISRRYFIHLEEWIWEMRIKLMHSIEFPLINVWVNLKRAWLN